VRDVAYWKRQAEDATRNVKILEHVAKMDGRSEDVFHTVKDWWDEREQGLREEYEKKLLDMEMAYTRDVELAMMERKRLDSALNCIRHVTTSLSPLEIEEEDAAEGGEEDEEDGSTIVHHVVVGDDETVSDGSVMYTREEEEESKGQVGCERNRCSVVGYRGELPDVLTENSLDRILDKPFCGEEARYSPSWKIPSIHTRTAMIPQEHIMALEKRLKKNRQEWSMRAAGDERSVEAVPGEKTFGGVRDDAGIGGAVRDDAGVGGAVRDDDAGVGGAVRDDAGIGGAVRDDAGIGGAVRDDNVVGEDDAFLRTIKALGDTSPKMANVLTQHVTDSWAVKQYGKHSTVNTKEDTAVQKKKSSFLQRTPIPLQKMFESSGTPCWMNATVL